MGLEINGTDVNIVNHPLWVQPKRTNVKFKLLQATPRRRTEDGWIPGQIPPQMFEAFYITQSAKGEPLAIRYYENRSPRNEKGTTVMVYNPGFIIIEGGTIDVNVRTNPGLYFFLSNHPACSTNPLYDLTTNKDAEDFKANMKVSFMFEELRPAATAEQELEREQLESTAVSAIKKYSNIQALQIYKAYAFKDVNDLETAGDYASMKLGIIKQMKQNYKKWEKLHNDSGLGIRARISDAVQYEVIKASDGNLYWDKTMDEKKRSLIMKFNDFGKWEEELYDYLRTDKDGPKLNEALKLEVEYASRNPDASRVQNKMAQAT